MTTIYQVDFKIRQGANTVESIAFVVIKDDIFLQSSLNLNKNMRLCAITQILEYVNRDHPNPLYVNENISLVRFTPIKTI